MFDKYERVSLLEKMIRFLILPLVSFQPIGEFIFVRKSSMGRRIKKYAATHLALEMIYTYSWEKTKNRKLFDRIFTHILFNFMNAKAARNRLRLVKKELKQMISSLNKQEIHIMSLGSGSARAIIETLAEQRDQKKIKITLVDQSNSALKYSKKLAKEYGIENIIFCKGLLEIFVKNGKNHPPDIVEMVGIMDYFDDYYAIKVMKEIYKLLSSDGIIITCNIHDNLERKFLTNILQWSMIYRDQRQLREVMKKSGFVYSEIKPEPLGIHRLAIGKKT